MTKNDAQKRNKNSKLMINELFIVLQKIKIQLFKMIKENSRIT
jgi:hypothetical protein